ncbi:trypsin-like peptidase domain-containing protein [Kitasatospora sp. NPDC086791]|uniref:trypsin-like peptidase domain-containing protein n=1 Tax=Kitasatospora sp. NPDC086791 TaxID=3155178 RepID=UPI0034402848
MTDPVVRGAAVEVHDGPYFRGSGLLLAPGIVLTAAHVAHRARNEPFVTGPWGRAAAVHPVRLFPADPGNGRFHAFPDLALLTLATPVEPPPLILDTGEPPSGTAVSVAGFSPYTPAAGVQADSLLLTVAGPAAGYLRLTGDEVRDGFSGGVVSRLDTGAVCGVLKGSRDFDGVRGGWYTPLGALAAALPADDPLQALLTGSPAAHRPAMLPGARELLPVLLRVPDMDDPEFRRRVIRTADQVLADRGPLRVAHRSHATDHLLELLDTCLQHREPAAALAAVVDALDFLRPGLAPVHELRALTCLPKDGP